MYQTHATFRHIFPRICIFYWQFYTANILTLLLTPIVVLSVFDRESYCWKSGSSSINQFLWQTCQIIGFQVSLHSEKTWYLKNAAKPINLKYIPNTLHTCKFEIWSHQNMIKWKRIISVWNFMGAFYCFLEWKVIKNAHEKFPNRNYSFSFYRGFINSSQASEWHEFCAFYLLIFSASHIFFSQEKL